MSKIVIRGASGHNLKSVDVEIPHCRLTVVTGVSGSGKSSLVFDTLYKEGERRYLESFSSYARQFIGKLTRSSVEHIDGLSPAISINQATIVRNPRSTVGTMTELYDYLRLLFARLGKIKKQPLTMTVHPGQEASKLNKSFCGGSRGALIGRPCQGLFSKRAPLERRLFSFNSPYGACPVCKGLGVQDRIDHQLLIADPQKTLRQGALKITTPSGYIIYSQVTIEVLNRVCQAHGFSVDIPWKDLNEAQRKIVLYGSDKIKIPFGKHPLESRLRWTGITPKPREEGYYKGIIPIMENILQVKRNVNILRFARTMPCEACKGTRLRPEALAVTFRELDIAQMARQTIDRLYEFFAGLHFSTPESPVAEPLREIFLKRSVLLKKLGLGYLTLDRESTTLSTGEIRRLRLAAQVGSGLRGVMYVLDEPSVGLHPRDNQRLLEILRQLRDNGNTVIVVEHDEETIRSADWLIDIGPAAGVHGGEILFNGPTEKLLEPDAPDTYPLVKNSKTRAFMTGTETIEIPLRRRTGTGKILKITGAQEHNLKNIDVPFRLGVLNVVSGVSGAGKSTLVHDILANTLKKLLHKAAARPGKHKKIEGIEFIDKVIEIDQSPIGRTPRSNPATYTKLFDHIRDLFALLPESKARKWSKGRFSFNVKGGRCETCEGAGVRQIGMHFLGNVDAVCEECEGKRFNDQTLEIRYKKKNIYDILEMPIEEAAVFFNDHPKMKRYLQALLELGLGYIALGQPATTLSGGEAQRIKLAAELCRPSTGNTLYILDEPTTGLHTSDIKILLESLNRLIEKGNTVITVEHHPDFIKSADRVIDLGPGSGDKGGNLVAIGTPEQILSSTTRGALLKNRPPGPPTKLFIKTVSTHNLKNIDVEIPANRLTVITGVSGSGKSSLAFDTIFAEGQKRFLAGFSTYARRLLTDRSTDADVEECTGLTPPIAVNQKTIGRNPRSTVGTMTEIYDFYRLLFSRLGKPHCPTCNKPLKDGYCPTCDFKGQKTLSARMFSFNHHLGACNECKGLGITRTCDPGKLVTHPDHSLLNGAMEGSKTGRFYGDPFGQYTAILQAVGEAEGIDFTLSWKELNHKARQIAMYGTGEKKYNVAWKFKRKNREGVHRFESVWKGFVNYINREYERKHADKRGQAMLHLMTDKTCPRCNGQRLKPEFLSVYFAGVNIAQLCSKTVKESIKFFQIKSFCGGELNDEGWKGRRVEGEKTENGRQKTGGRGRLGVGTRFIASSELEASIPFLHENSNALYDYRHFDTFSADSVQLKKPSGGPKGLIGPPCHGAPLVAEGKKEIIKRLGFLRDMGLDYLTLDRCSITLSSGEAQRIRLARQLGSGLTNITYVLDEPTIGLHSRDICRLLSVLKNLRDTGNTVIVVEHDAEVIREADYIIDLGPGAGREGGHIVARGSVQQLKNNKHSKTGQYLIDPNIIPVPRKRRNLEEGLQITGAFANNLQGIDIPIPSGGIIVITGVSGSGKSTLLFDVAAASLEKREPIGCRSIIGFDNYNTVIKVDQEPIGSSPASNPATYTGIFTGIREIFAMTETARINNYKKNRFSFNIKGGRCEVCQGMGRVHTSMDFLADVWTICDECKGKRYNEETLQCKFQGKTIADVLEMTVNEAIDFFPHHPHIHKTLKIMEEVGLDYLQLGQPANTLSGGESQRLKLVNQLIKGKGKKNLYLLDEPTTGLHFEDIGRLLALFHRLAGQGHTLVVIEHHPDIIKNADYVIDLGPEGGDRGGRIVAKGTPEEVAKVNDSHTGEIMKNYLT
jgi:excinuclease ABC subunit A